MGKLFSHVVLLVFSLSANLCLAMNEGEASKSCAESLRKVSHVGTYGKEKGGDWDNTAANVTALTTHFKADPIKSKANNWKRLSKWKAQHDLIVRVFQAKDGTQMTVTTDTSDYASGGGFIKIYNGGTESPKPGIFPRMFRPESTGRVLWHLDEDYGGDPDEIAFSCAPEDADSGWTVEEQDSQVEPTLEHLFKDRLIEVSAMENMHIVHVNEGESRDSIVELIRQRLNGAGAIERKEP